ncbi:cob(I)yrinic acid a,c-diamide adenosyltransferase [Aquisalinus flavus]|uniref:Corrinoid adenosyltransferase n=1 Tax=Aquisalinus flavus TaxID=1526572 RepID=A0A8J2Y709_9PROT|nr:cob(I)yrinic acid a,c-diamide adenosyltransferase [Aquisalinus flavus]MBD0426814.1 cob(I)yrinic acid a,c-diamide adenosyltransferase [Aquisalinus flavus]UNE46662.1 cob(I)yrinic acid a,c-diamide adenosyltransferase [Aquisalinus flavus]GGC96214.1 cob(I)yrinic acid a,c-diamide adenosyltransferase [Aquisalinus flavus]
MVKLTKIYTRTGDDGTTGLVTGDRVPKTHPRVGAMGSVDELNAAIGMVLSALPDGHGLATPLGAIQNDLFDVGADLATPGELEGALRVTPQQVTWLEERIDAINETMPPLTSFVLPAGNAAAANAHLARAIARRAERDVWLLIEAEPGATVSRHIATYLNRLSDFLFVAARQLARDTGEETLWQPGANRPR